MIDVRYYKQQIMIANVKPLRQEAKAQRLERCIHWFDPSRGCSMVVANIIDGYSKKYTVKG